MAIWTPGPLQVKPPQPVLRPKNSHFSTTGLVGYWLFHEGAGGVIHDLSGNDHHATITSAAGYSWRPGPRGPVLYMSGAGRDNYAEAILPATDYHGLTIILSERLTSGAEQNMWFDGGTAYIFFRPKNDDWQLRFQDTTLRTLPSGDEDDVWHQYAVTFDGSDVRAYRDGILVSTTGGGNYFDAMRKFHIIGGQYGDDVDADYDNVVLYNRALSTAELLAYANEPLIALQPQGLRWLADAVAEEEVIMPRIAHYYRQLRSA